MAIVGEPPGFIDALAGTEHVVIDAKGRLSLGAYKEKLGDVFAVNIGMRGCICVYPQVHWQRYMREINACPTMNEGRMEFIEYFFEYAQTNMSCDNQGRVVLPVELRRKGMLRDKVLVKGVYDHLEIWDEEEHDIFRSDMAAYNQERRLKMKAAYERMMLGAQGAKA